MDAVCAMHIPGVLYMTKVLYTLLVTTPPTVKCFIMKCQMRLYYSL